MQHWRTFAVACSILLTALGSHEAEAQRKRITRDDVGRLYAEARFQQQYLAFVSRHGSTVAPHPTEWLAVTSDTLTDWIRSRNPALFTVKQEKEKPWSGQVESWTLVSPDERLAWLDRFSDVKWAYLGNNYFTALDTVDTPEIRARMEGYFGIPTQTLVEQKPHSTGQIEEYVQFEYWFTINDSLPLVITDVDGPFDRGVLVEGDHRYRHMLYKMRQSLLAAMMRDEKPAAYMDYYFNIITGEWYRSGFDGVNYVLRHIRAPNLARGRPEQPVTDGG